MLLQSYKRNSNDIQILDEILIQSEKRQIDKDKAKYKSNMAPVIAESKIFKKNVYRPQWMS